MDVRIIFVITFETGRQVEDPSVPVHVLPAQLIGLTGAQSGAAHEKDPVRAVQATLARAVGFDVLHQPDEFRSLGNADTGVLTSFEAPFTLLTLDRSGRNVPVRDFRYQVLLFGEGEHLAPHDPLGLGGGQSVDLERGHEPVCAAPVVELVDAGVEQALGTGSSPRTPEPVQDHVDVALGAFQSSWLLGPAQDVGPCVFPVDTHGGEFSTIPNRCGRRKAAH